MRREQSHLLRSMWYRKGARSGVDTCLYTYYAVFASEVLVVRNWSSGDIIRLLRKDGWHVVRIRGSHHQFRHTTKPGLVTVPHPRKHLPIKTASSILKQAGLE